MTSRSEHEPTVNADDDETYCSLIIHEDQVESKLSPISGILKESQKLLKGDPETVTPARDFTDKELELFKQVLDREIHESKYTIVGKVASGGMGSIYCVFDKDIGRNTILKVILPSQKGKTRIIERFIYEAKLTGLLEHPNIVPLHDFGFLPGYGIFFTMTYVHGESLLDIIHKLKIKDPEFYKKYDTFTLIGMFRKVCDAVAYAHSKNIIHRDIKPENIMVGQYGEVILMDWGLAKKLDIDEDDSNGDRDNWQQPVAASAPDKTQFGEIKGTPAYLSPEQASGKPYLIDKSSDIFLLGSTLYHMFIYSAPFIGLGLRDAIGRARRCEYKSPNAYSSRNERLSKELCRIITKAMAKEKQDRYATVQALITDLDDMLRGAVELESVVFNAGDILVEEGDFGTSCYIILRGSVEVFKTVNGSKIPLERLLDGDIVGEMALITDQPRTASVVAVEETEAVVLNQDIFTHNLKKLPPWLEKTVTALANRLSASNVRLTDSTVIDRNEVYGSGDHPFTL